MDLRDRRIGLSRYHKKELNYIVHQATVSRNNEVYID